MVELKQAKLYTIEVNGCELIDIYCGYDLEKELLNFEKDFVEAKIKENFWKEYGKELDLNYWKVKTS